MLLKKKIRTKNVVQQLFIKKTELILNLLPFFPHLTVVMKGPLSANKFQFYRGIQKFSSIPVGTVSTRSVRICNIRLEFPRPLRDNSRLSNPLHKRYLPRAIEIPFESKVPKLSDRMCVRENSSFEMSSSGNVRPPGRPWHVDSKLRPVSFAEILQFPRARAVTIPVAPGLAGHCCLRILCKKKNKKKIKYPEVDEG